MDNNTKICPQSGMCGGCIYQGIPYEEQLKEKENRIRELLSQLPVDCHYTGIIGSPRDREYRNKMEFSFGDCEKGGSLQLGMHKKRSFYDILSARDCSLIDSDYRKILAFHEDFFEERKTSFYHKKSHRGFLRHLLLRKGMFTGEILVDLVTSSDDTLEEKEYREGLLALDLEGSIVGILHTTNDSLSDVVKNDRTDILFGNDYFTEKLLGLTFKISPFSFFQTNSYGAEVLYDTVRSFAAGIKCNTLYDLYSGTGTIAQILAPISNEVVGVEIVEEAVDAARENAERNKLDNCRFIAGDVKNVIDSLDGAPELIILDPPREGINPSAIKKIIGFNANTVIYVSCKPESMIKDMKFFLVGGYEIKKITSIDMFPSTKNVENVVLLSKIN